MTKNFTNLQIQAFGYKIFIVALIINHKTIYQWQY